MSLLLERVRRALAPEFEIEHQIGAGGMGVVFAARDRRLDRRVAIKVLRPGAATAATAERFLREARLLARLRHANVVTVYQAGEADGLPYFAMEMVEGETLAARLARGPLSPAEAVVLGVDVLAALGAAHRHGIVHRDVKPANIFLVKGRALLGDFGIARGGSSADDETVTRAGGSPGTPRYMAPEQRAGERATPATDVYAAGLVLFEALTGRSWQPLANPAAADWAGVPPRLVRALRRALAPAPGERWPSAEAFGRAMTRRGPNRLLVPLAAVVALALVLGAAFRLRDHAASDLGGAAPRTREGQRLLDQAEAHYRNARWVEAGRAYQRAFDADTTCLICAFRLDDVDNWLQRPHDPSRTAFLLERSPRFPLHYRRLLEAAHAPHPGRLDLLRDVTERWPDFTLAWYLYGEDLYNRGALFGRLREEAIWALRRAVTLDSAFAPPWFDLAFAQIAEGDSAGAAKAVAVLGRMQPTGDLAQVQRAAAYVAFGFRFGETGMQRYREVTRDPRLAAMPDAAAGPRIMPGLGTPAGAVELGHEYARRTDPEEREFRRSGLIALMFGHAALGRRDSMREAGRRLARSFPTQAVQSLGPRLDAALLLWDNGFDRSEVDALASELEPFLRAGVEMEVRNGAAWMLAVLAFRRGDTVRAQRYAGLVREDVTPGSRTILLEGWRSAARGHTGAALDGTEALARSLAVFDNEPDPFLRAAVRLSRALWMEQEGSVAAARDEYRWHAHFHLAAYPKGEPIAAEGDWALSTLAAWRQARLFDGAEPGPELCRAYTMVAERWSSAEERYRARADTARARLGALGCGGGRDSM